jgi:hypothetical protein
MKKKLTFSASAILLALFMVFPVQKAEAKFWGRDVDEDFVTAPDGRCWKQTCTTVYRFGIPFDRGCDWEAQGPVGQPCN